ncbi:MAG: fatty-acid synthase [Sphaerospermopsis sp. SIO1G2]|nr:fatty-acid synthase [Sphaerospermopsis sp. SIO1G2]
MPARDLFHQAVANALLKDGWEITDDPLRLIYGGRNLYVDLGAEQPLAAQKNNRKIAVEIKSFISESDIYDLQLSIGQYQMYRDILQESEPDRDLYLAVPSRAFDTVFQEPIGRLMIEKRDLYLIVFNGSEEEIVQWIPH